MYNTINAGQNNIYGKGRLDGENREIILGRGAPASQILALNGISSLEYCVPFSLFPWILIKFIASNLLLAKTSCILDISQAAGQVELRRRIVMSEEKKAVSVRLHEILRKNNMSDVKSLIGDLLTITDSITSDSVQRKALKNLVENTVWRSYWDQMKRLDYFMERLANATGEDAQWAKYNKEPLVGDQGPKNKKPYNPLTV